MGSCSQESYVRLGRRWRRARGFRLCPRNRFSVRRLRAKLLTILGLVGRYVRLLVGRLHHSSSGSRRRVFVGAKLDGGLSPNYKPAAAGKAQRRQAAPTSFVRSNSFYAQAIADCLEFIKRNSVPVEDYGSASARRLIIDMGEPEMASFEIQTK